MEAALPDHAEAIRFCDEGGIDYYGDPRTAQLYYVHEHAHASDLEQPWPLPDTGKRGSGNCAGCGRWGEALLADEVGLWGSECGGWAKWPGHPTSDTKGLRRLGSDEPLTPGKLHKLVVWLDDDEAHALLDLLNRTGHPELDKQHPLGEQEQAHRARVVDKVLNRPVWYEGTT